MSRSDLAYSLALALMPGVGARTYQKSCDKYGSPEAAILSPELKKNNISWERINKLIDWSEQSNQFILSIHHPDYPVLLKQIPDPPPILYGLGDPALLSKPQIAMVGSRRASAVGCDTSHHFAKFLANHGFVITSGLAQGIDTAAHSGALESGQTIAVCGTGVDIVYPGKNRQLAAKIQQNGVIISEFPLGTEPKANHFPQRNRIISGLSVGVLVVEAAIASGSLITARFANEQGREVFAIPGGIHNVSAKGCHKLIQNGAKLVQSVQDIIEELPAIMGFAAEQAQITLPAPVDLPSDLAHFLEKLSYETAPIDLIIAETGLTADKVSSMLLALECEGLVDSIQGGYRRL